MVLLTAKGVRKSFCEKQLLEDITFSINEGDKIGLVGVNGSGKSTLLRIVAGDLEAEGGEILRSNELRIAYLPQNPQYDPEATVLEQAMRYVQSGLTKGAQGPGTSNPGSGAQSHPDSPVEDYIVKSYLTRVHMDMFDKPLKELSGGQRKRIALAAVMCSGANLLILDEPTNHMDNDIIEWMEEQLCDYKGAILMITHDRYFLERITDRICEIEKGKLVCYEGNYEAYLVAKAERLQMAIANERKRANLYRKELRWIRWTAPARTTKSRSRVQRFQQIEAARETFDNPQLEIDAISSRLGKKIIEINNISKSFDGVAYIRDFSYNVLRNDRIGIVGDNGCGKTTLLRLIMGQLEPDSGTIETGETVRIGYFSQEAQEMDPDMRIIKYVEDIASNIRTKEGWVSASQMLEKFLFPPYMHSVKIEKLSGGEKRRLYLLTILMQAPNILILDEPTNDLDIDTLTVLEDYLDDFPGAVIIVSHDRYFLDRLVVRTFAFEEGGHIGHYTGGYSKYMNEKDEREALAKRARQSAQGTGDAKGGKNAGSSGAATGAQGTGNAAGNGAAPNVRSDGRNQRAPKLKFTYNEKKEFETIDEVIAGIEAEIETVDAEIFRHALDAAVLTELTTRKDDLEQQLLEKMDRWEYLNELAEKIERGERAE